VGDAEIRTRCVAASGCPDALRCLCCAHNHRRPFFGGGPAKTHAHRPPGGCSAGPARTRVVHVRRTVSSGEVVELAKTARSLRQVPLSNRALDALAELPPRLDTPLLFPAKGGGLLNLDNWRRREWAPAIEAAGIARPARIYDLRATFASRALAAGVSVFELAKVMGTSVQMIERAYCALLDGAGAEITARLDAFDQQATDEAESV
jgi:integrase